MSEPVMVGGAPAAPGNRRALLLLGVAALVAVVALVLPRLLFAGGDEAADDFADIPVVAQAGGIAGGTAATDVVEAEPVRTFEVFSTKNPFTPLMDLTPGTGAAAPAIVAGTDTAPALSTTVAPTGTSGGATEPGSGQRIALLEVFVNDDAATVASIRVNDTVYEVAEGEAFATRYQAVTLSVADGCGQFLYGDNRFRLCEGEELLK